MFGLHDYWWSELRNISANYGCWGNLLGVLVDKARRGLGGFQVGCYSVEHYDGDADHLRSWKYFAMCNHGSKSGGADTRQDAIYLAKQSKTYCGDCYNLTYFSGNRILCIECVREILERDLVPGDFVSNPMTMRSGGIITQLFHNEEELTAEEASALSKLKEELSQEDADRVIQEVRSLLSVDWLDADYSTCKKCELRVWGDLGLSKDSTAGYSLDNKIWNHVWERWEQIRDNQGE